MKKIVLYIFLGVVALSGRSAFSQQAHRLVGKVVSADDGTAVPAATVAILETGQRAATDRSGLFDFRLSAPRATVTVKSINHEAYEGSVALPHPDTLIVKLHARERSIGEVIVSTGYEDVPIERTTGAFERLGPESIGRNVGTNIMGRLENMAAGMHFNRLDADFNQAGAPEKPDVFIRGISTMRQSTGRNPNAPLVILDNFPFEGDLNLINPNDIESVTVLKDAAAASIWGAKAGNGVLVVTSRKAGLDRPFRVSFSQTTSMTGKPDLFARPVIASADVVAMERFLFEEGFYRFKEMNPAKPALSPAVETLIQLRDGLIGQGEADRRLEGYGTHDVRTDMLRYLYRPALQQQYALTASGGSAKAGYTLFAGYDRSAHTRVGNGDERVTVRAGNTLKPTAGMEADVGVLWVATRGSGGGHAGFYSDNGHHFPYARLADDDGKAIPIAHDYRLGFVDTAGAGQLLDWHFRPIDDARNTVQRSSGHLLQFNAGIGYRPTHWLRLDAKYQFSADYGRSRALNDLDSYHTRNQVNRGSQVTGNGVVYHFPLGSILGLQHRRALSHQGRFQAGVDRQWGVHEVRALAGAEVQERASMSEGSSLVGYNDDVLTYPRNLNYAARFPVFANLAPFGTLPSPFNDLSETTNRFVSGYGNASYTYDGRYIISVSGRKDASNIFGVASNDRWNPLWSLGMAWNLHKERFFRFPWLAYAKLRATYGYNGNVDNSMSALTTLSYSSNILQVNYPLAGIVNPPNPSLRWEKVGTANAGFDFTLRGDWLSGSVDVYGKRTADLFGIYPLDPTTGMNAMTMNVANTESRGVDVRLTARHRLRAVKLESDLMFSYNNNWITRSYMDYASGGGPALVLNGFLSPLEGTIAYPLYSYRWAGLDPETGQAMGYLDGVPSTDYVKLMSGDVPLDGLAFHGSARPLYFGAFRNSVGYRGFELSANLSWKFAYHFRRASIDYGELFDRNDGHRDFYDRWQKPGDERHTDVPSMAYPVGFGNGFYRYAEILVERGDHIRIQDVRLAYQLPFGVFRSVKGASLFAYCNNVGFVWRANRQGLDPDVPGSIPQPRVYAAGFSITL